MASQTPHCSPPARLPERLNPVRTSTIPRAIAVLVLAAAVAVSCSSGSQVASSTTSGVNASGSAASAAQTISFTGSDAPATYAPVIKAFHAKFLNITVQYSQIPQASFSSTLQQRLASKDSSLDVFTVDAGTVPELAAQKFLVDLSTLMDQTKAITTADEYNTNIFQGKQWALPVWTSTQLLFYNKDALKKAGVAAPSIAPDAPATWEQIAADGATVQKKAGVQSGILFEQPAAYYELQPLAEGLGGGSGVTGDGLTTDINNAGWIAAMQWYSSIYKSGVAPRIPNLQSQAYFTDGKTAYYIGGPWDVGIFSASKLAWGIAPLPKFASGKAVTPTGSWSWGISSFSTHRAAAEEFAKFASLTTQGNRATTEATTIIPANTAAAADYLPSLEKLAGAKSAGVTAIMTHAAKNTAVLRPNSVGYVQFESAANKAFSDIQNGADVPSRLNQLKQQIETAWKSLR